MYRPVKFPSLEILVFIIGGLVGTLFLTKPGEEPKPRQQLTAARIGWAAAPPIPGHPEYECWMAHLDGDPYGGIRSVVCLPNSEQPSSKTAAGNHHEAMWPMTVHGDGRYPSSARF